MVSCRYSEFKASTGAWWRFDFSGSLLWSLSVVYSARKNKFWVNSSPNSSSHDEGSSVDYWPSSGLFSVSLNCLAASRDLFPGKMATCSALKFLHCFCHLSLSCPLWHTWAPSITAWTARSTGEHSDIPLLQASKSLQQFTFWCRLLPWRPVVFQPSGVDWCCKK